jgi:hypothetical protein
MIREGWRRSTPVGSWHAGRMAIRRIACSLNISLPRDRLPHNERRVGSGGLLEETCHERLRAWRIEFQPNPVIPLVQLLNLQDFGPDSLELVGPSRSYPEVFADDGSRRRQDPGAAEAEVVNKAGGRLEDTRT